MATTTTAYIFDYNATVVRKANTIVGFGRDTATGRSLALIVNNFRGSFFLSVTAHVETTLAQYADTESVINNVFAVDDEYERLRKRLNMFAEIAPRKGSSSPPAFIHKITRRPVRTNMGYDSTIDALEFVIDETDGSTKYGREHLVTCLCQFFRSHPTTDYDLQRLAPLRSLQFYNHRETQIGQLFSRHGIGGCSTVRYPTTAAVRHKTHHVLRNVAEIHEVDFDTLVLAVDVLAPLPRVLYYDIEAVDSRWAPGIPCVFPDPQFAAVICIGVVMHDGGGATPRKVVFNLHSLAPIDGVDARCFEREYDMFRAFQDYVADEDPDVLSGYNNARFDNTFLARRWTVLINADVYHPRDPGLNLGRTAQPARITSVRGAFRLEDQLLVWGRAVFDYLLYVLYTDQQSLNTLDAVARRKLDQGKGERKLNIAISSMAVHCLSEEGRTTIAVYCLQDTWLVYLLEARAYKGIAFAQTLANMTGAQFHTAVMFEGLQTFLNPSLSREYTKAGLAIGNYNDYCVQHGLDTTAPCLIKSNIAGELSLLRARETAARRARNREVADRRWIRQRLERQSAMVSKRLAASDTKRAAGDRAIAAGKLKSKAARDSPLANDTYDKLERELATFRRMMAEYDRQEALRQAADIEAAEEAAPPTTEEEEEETEEPDTDDEEVAEGTPIDASMTLGERRKVERGRMKLAADTTGTDFCTAMFGCRPLASDNNGGLVLAPAIGVRSNVLLEDFNSLYPSIIIVCNCSPETLLSAELASSLGLVHNVQYLEVPLTDRQNPGRRVFYIHRSIKRGILPEYMERLIDARKAVRAEMEAAKRRLGSLEKQDPAAEILRRHIEVLNSRQLAYKLIANGVFGTMGMDNRYSQFGHICIANTITSTGRAMMFTMMRKVLRDFESEHLRVLMGDTDSIGFHAPRRTLAEAKLLGVAIESHMNAFYGATAGTVIDLSALKIGFETYGLFLCRKMKSYVIYSPNPDGATYTKKVMGFQCKHRGTPVFAATLQRLLLDILVVYDRDRDGWVARARDVLIEARDRLVGGQVPYTDIAMSACARAQPDPKPVLSHHKLVAELYRQKSAYMPHPRSRFVYYIVVPVDSVKADAVGRGKTQLAKLGSDVVSANYRLDLKFYVDRFIVAMNYDVLAAVFGRETAIALRRAVETYVLPTPPPNRCVVCNGCCQVDVALVCRDCARRGTATAAARELLTVQLDEAPIVVGRRRAFDAARTMCRTACPYGMPAVCVATCDQFGCENRFQRDTCRQAAVDVNTQMSKLGLTGSRPYNLEW